jgi:Fe-S cluster assembly ATP-binding protein
MGPNGSGKSTLAYTIMGHPKYQVTSGDIFYEDQSILNLSPDKRAKLGLFLAFQYPVEVPGVNMSLYLKRAYDELNVAQVFRPAKPILSVDGFRKLLEEKLDTLKISVEFLDRSLNEGFSGGEKKKAEILQMSVLNPEMIIMDETDSGLDIDSLKLAAEAVRNMMSAERSPSLGLSSNGPSEGRSLLLITHNQRILKNIEPDFVHILVDGKIVRSGGKELAHELEEKGYMRY